jgi:hypothetical protein
MFEITTTSTITLLKIAFLNTCDGRGSLPDLIVWSDEVTFKLNGTVNSHNCVYWATENPNIMEEQALNLPGTSVWFGLFSIGML